MAPERINKVLAAAGLGSRRACDELIQAGRVTVNGLPATCGMKVEFPGDMIICDGQTLTAVAKFHYLKFNKPVGMMSSLRDPHYHNTIGRAFKNYPVRLFPVGRLDVDSEGLLLLTNDGDLANRIAHPRHHQPKVYHVHLDRKLEAAPLARLRQGVPLPDGHYTAPCEIEPLDENSYRFTLREGRKRQIREMARTVDRQVLSLKRVMMGGVAIDDLKPGEWRPLTEAEIARLRESDPKPV